MSITSTDMWETLLKIAILTLVVAIATFIFVGAYKLARADEIYTVFDSDGHISFTNVPKVEVEIDEYVQVDIKEEDYFEHYRDRELLRQEEDIEQWWEDDYRDYLREQGVSEGLMRGW